MSHWMKFRISMDQIINGTQAEIMKNTKDIFRLLPDKKHVALLSISKPGIGSDLYVSPKAVKPLKSIINYYGGIVSEPPPKQTDPYDISTRTGLLVGDPNIKELLE